MDRWLVEMLAARVARLPLIVLAVFLSLAGSSSRVFGSNPDVTAAASQPPSPRCCAAMAYDGAGKLILYGGASSITNLADTWSFDGSAWALLNPPTSPGELYDAAMTYDATRNVIVLFGGQGADSDYTNATYTWNGTAWTLLSPATSPSPRASAYLAYDSINQVAILFGGCCGGGGEAFSDTWEWNGAAWIQKSPTTSPPGSDSASMVFDAAMGKVVYFSGCCNLSETWTWDGANWTKLTTATSPTLGGAMAYDGGNGTIVLLQTDGTTFTFDGTNWIQQFSTTSPGALSQAAIAYDQTTQTVLVVGGSLGGWPQGNTYSWDGSNWTLLGQAVATGQPPA